jgi:hypothetical protein
MVHRPGARRISGAGVFTGPGADTSVAGDPDGENRRLTLFKLIFD